MTSPQGLHFKTILLMLIMVSVAPLGDVFLGKGMKRIGALPSWAPADLFRFFFRAFTSRTVWIGIGLLLAFFIAYLVVLSWADYSYVQPASSASYVLIALLAHFVLHETISPLRWAGVAVICTGVFVVGHTHPQTPEHHSW
ncbi:MAG TPA: EamA family transporter [Candidatus Acidoferrales bacterium]|nr:EamA family transporter [Candidatus Acidoferrales bacterium]